MNTWLSFHQCQVTDFQSHISRVFLILYKVGIFNLRERALEWLKKMWSYLCVFMGMFLFAHKAFKNKFISGNIKYVYFNFC